MEKLNVVIPMAGLGYRFTEYGFSINKYMLPVNVYLDKMIEMAILSLGIKNIDCTFIFIIREDSNNKDTNLYKLLTDICSVNNYKCHIISIDRVTEGPASSVYLAKDFINNEVPLIISNSDQILEWNFDNFINKCKEYDGCVLTYCPDYELILGQKDKHSFVKCDDDGNPLQFIEKTVISKEALVGIHYYKKGSYFIESAEYIFKHNIRAPNNEFYISYTYDALLKLNYKLGTYILNSEYSEYFYPVGEPIDYFTYYNKFGTIKVLSIDELKMLDDYKQYINIESIETSVTISNELLVNLKSGDIITTGNNYTLDTSDTILRVKNINNEYSIVDRNKYIRGWLIGNFEPSILKTSDFELGILSHKKNEKWQFHYHKYCKEINILLKGKMIINNISINTGDVFIFDKNVISCPLFLDDCIVVCIKIPSIPNDKEII